MADPRAVVRAIEQRLGGRLPWSRTSKAAHEWRRAADALAVLLELPDGEQAARLDALGRTDPPLRREVESLLAAHRRSGPLDHPVLDGLSIAPGEGGEDAGTESSLTWGLDTIVAQYRLIGAVGHGGMGVVVKAWDQRLERTVALKFLPSTLLGNAVALERFRVEAQATAGLEHPNICTIYEVGETSDERFFIAMPYYQGETIAARLARGPLSVDDARALALQTARGLAKAHERGIVHRDIKPANLIVTSDGVLKILDFGIAKLGGVALTLPGLTPGTTAYMSPEQTRGDAIDARTDIWSLGVVLYEMLAGVRPFAGHDARAVGAAICSAEPESIAARRHDVPPSLAYLVHAALAKDPDRRPASAARVAQALDAIGMLLTQTRIEAALRHGQLTPDTGRDAEPS